MNAHNIEEIIKEMNAETKSPGNFDEYIAIFPENIQTILKQMQTIIRETAPEASEKISYQMPTFYLKGNLVHFAACKNHIGFYPAPSGIEAFSRELSGYKCSKGAAQFPLNHPLPVDLIKKIVLFRVKENLEKAASKK